MNRLHTLVRSGLVIAAASVSLVACDMMPMKSKANADLITFGGALSGAKEVPATSTGGSGTAEAWLNKSNNQLKWKVVYSGLSGKAAAGHIHGPALAGANAGVLIPFVDPSSPIEGQATLTQAQMADLMAGKMYVNIHTAAHPGGEIRAQLVPKI
ncbi:MAG: CHRD domain-containing protein [Variovorax sp.]